jgi:hypothetical protein
MSAICSVLGIARRTAYYVVRARPGGRYHRADDSTVLQQIRAVTNSRATYGYRRVWAMVNRTFRGGYNRKRQPRDGNPSAHSSHLGWIETPRLVHGLPFYGWLTPGRYWSARSPSLPGHAIVRRNALSSRASTS